jgi:hypothetical protein
LMVSINLSLRFHDILPIVQGRTAFPHCVVAKMY